MDGLVQSVQQNKFGKFAAITFDDGYKDLYENAFPILRALNIPFSLFLTTSTVESKKLLWQHKYYYLIERLTPGQKEKFLFANNYHNHLMDFEQFIDYVFFNKKKTSMEELVANMVFDTDFNEDREKVLAGKLYLSKDELLEMQKHGLSIEIHGHEHWPLSVLDKQDTEIEIKNSEQYLKQELKTTPHYFGLPYGIKNNYFRDTIHTLGLVATCGSGSRVVSSLEDIQMLPRIGRFFDAKSFNLVIYNAYSVYLKGYMKSLLFVFHR